METIIHHYSDMSVAHLREHIVTELRAKFRLIPEVRSYMLRGVKLYATVAPRCPFGMILVSIERPECGESVHVVFAVGWI